MRLLYWGAMAAAIAGSTAAGAADYNIELCSVEVSPDSPDGLLEPCLDSSGQGQWLAKSSCTEDVYVAWNMDDAATTDSMYAAALTALLSARGTTIGLLDEGDACPDSGCHSTYDPVASVQINR